jgi:hypothetical protein
MPNGERPASMCVDLRGRVYRHAQPVDRHGDDVAAVDILGFRRATSGARRSIRRFLLLASHSVGSVAGEPGPAEAASLAYVSALDADQERLVAAAAVGRRLNGGHDRSLAA